MAKVILEYTNNPAYKGLEGKEGELYFDAIGNFQFSYDDKVLSSHIDGRLGELGDVYRSPEISIRTGICEFVFDQRTPYLEQEKAGIEPEQSKYTIMLDKDYDNLWKEATQGNPDVIAKYNDITSKIGKGEILVVSDIPNIKQYLEAGNRYDIEIVDRGEIKFRNLPYPNSDLVSIAVNPVGDSIDAVYGRGDLRDIGGKQFNDVLKEKLGLKEEINQEKIAPKIMLYEDYNKMRTEFFANRNNAELAAEFNDIAAKIQKDEIMLIPNAAEYVKKHLDAGNRDNIEVVGRGTIGFQNIPCSDLVAISVNPVGNDLVGVYSHGEVEIDARFGNLENAIEQNTVGNDAPDIADDILR